MKPCTNSQKFERKKGKSNVINFSDTGFQVIMCLVNFDVRKARMAEKTFAGGTKSFKVVPLFISFKDDRAFCHCAS